MTDTRFLAYLTIDITYACNLNCAFCSKRISERHDYKHMTEEQLAVVLKFVAPHYKIVHITGGEPLVHPQFNSMMRVLLERFERVVVTSNGIALDTVDKDIYDRLNFLVSVYPGVNDDVVDLVEPHSNVVCRRESKTSPGLCDPHYDPDIGSDEECKRVYAGCCYSYAKVVGSRVYPCCHGETMETFYGVKETGVTIDENWIENLQQVGGWRACRHCFLAYPQPYRRAT